MKNNIEIIDTVIYAGRLKDKKSLLYSSSGGAFVAISDAFLNNGDADKKRESVPILLLRVRIRKI